MNKVFKGLLALAIAALLALLAGFVYRDYVVPYNELAVNQEEEYADLGNKVFFYDETGTSVREVEVNVYGNN